MLNSSSNSGEVSSAIRSIKKILDDYYLNDIDEQKLVEGAIQGYVAGLEDPYTQYITKNEMEEYTTNLLGNYVGVGIYMAANIEKNVIEIIMPIKGSPAEEVGLQAGDIITAVDGIKYTGEDIDIAADKIKGEEGSIVKLEILRSQEVKTFEIRRRRVVTNPVEAEKLENGIGYIQITSFDEGTAEDFKLKYEGLRRQGIKSLIIDLRNNGGGLVDETLKIADFIVPKGKTLLITVDKNEKEDVEKAEQDVLIDMPIVVLVNKNSASSSEILAGALKDLDEATIVGITSNRNKINGIGIAPDVVVELPEAVLSPLYVERNEDTQLQKAIEILK